MMPCAGSPMKLTLLGTGCPVVSARRYGPAQWIEHDDTNVLVDCGSGVTQRMLQAGYSGRDVDAVLLTHLHSDHVIDLYQLVISSWHQGRQRPQQVYGPPGTGEFVRATLDVWAQERAQRIAWEKRTCTAALQVELHELVPHERLKVGSLDIHVVPVDHQPVRDAFGFVFDDGSSRVALSGDTRMCDALIDAARGVDLLVHEVYAHSQMPEPGGHRTPAGLKNASAYHTLESEVGVVASRAGARQLVLTHIVPPHCDTDQLADMVRRDFDGPLAVGEDLAVFETPVTDPMGD